MIAHSVAAALVVWAVVVGAAAVDRSRWPWLAVAGVPVLVAAAALLRTEVALYAGGLGLAIIAVGALERRPVILVAGLAMGGSALLARAIDARLVGRIVGTPVGSTGAFEVRQRGGGLIERWDGFVRDVAATGRGR